MSLTIDQLQVLEAIEAHGSFTAAAAHLHRATSALSYSIRGLEDALGLELFDRSHRKATLTPAGARVLVEGRRVLQSTAALERTAAQLAEGWEPHLEFVVDARVPMAPILAAVTQFASAGTSTELRVSAALFDEVRARFDSSSADLMLGFAEASDSQLRRIPLPPLEMLLVADGSHPLGTQTRRVQREELEEHVEVRLRGSGEALGRNTFSFSDVAAQHDAITAGLGFGWLPRHRIASGLANSSIRIVTFEEGFRRRLVPYLSHRRDRPPGRAGELLRQALMHEIRALTGRTRRAL